MASIKRYLIVLLACTTVGVVTYLAGWEKSSHAAARTQWEYKIVLIDISNLQLHKNLWTETEIKMNEMGAGWEFVRPLEDRSSPARIFRRAK